MYTLRKHKKRGADGFKDFVRNLETFTAATVKEMLQLGLIEDPVYLKWAMENRISFQHLVNLEAAHIMKVFNKVPNRLQILVMSLKNSDDEAKFLAKLPEALQRQYRDEKEFTQVTTALRAQARHKMMSAMFELENSGELDPFVWSLPPVRVLQGEDHSLDENGQYIQYYTPPLENIVALHGPLEEGLRAGLWKHYYPNGELIAEGHYVSGEKAGPWKFFYPDQKIWMEGSFEQGLKEGPWQEYDTQGRSREVLYKKGSPI